MLIQLSENGQAKQREICDILGAEELLGQLTEECGELIQAAQKTRRVICGTTPVNKMDALGHLAEEAADVALCIDTLIRSGLINADKVQSIGQYKNERWHERTTG